MRKTRCWWKDHGLIVLLVQLDKAEDWNWFLQLSVVQSPNRPRTARSVRSVESAIANGSLLSASGDAGGIACRMVMKTAAVAGMKAPSHEEP